VKTILLFSLLCVGALFAGEVVSAPDGSGEVAASKPYLLAVRFAESSAALQSPPDSFLESARHVGIGVTETDAGYLSSSDAEMTYKIRKTGTSFSTELPMVIFTGTSNITLNTRLSLREDRWTLVSEQQQNIGGSAPRFFYVLARILKRT